MSELLVELGVVRWRAAYFPLSLALSSGSGFRLLGGESSPGIACSFVGEVVPSYSAYECGAEGHDLVKVRALAKPEDGDQS